MRTSYRSRFLFGRDINDYQNYNRFLGVFFAQGGYSEQEWGISALLNSYGAIPYADIKRIQKDNCYNELSSTIHTLRDYKPIFGFDGRQIHFLPHELSIENAIIEGQKCYSFCGCTLNENIYKNTVPNDLVIRQTSYSGDLPMATAWSDNDFGILTTSQNKQYLEELKNAFENLDIAMCYNIDTFSQFAYKTTGNYGGMFFLIRSRLTKTLEKKQKQADIYNYDTYQRFLDTNIIQYLKDREIEFSCIYPTWGDKEQKELLVYFEPNYNQTKPLLKNQWYTIEQLKYYADTKTLPPM
jgi:hypothetical protein